MATGEIIRVEHNKANPYVIVNKASANDSSLSWGARGLLFYLLSKPDDWTVMVGDLVNQSPAGRQATRTILAELETKGYLKRTRMHGAKGRFWWETRVYETAQENTMGHFPADGPAADGPMVDIPCNELLNLDSPNGGIPPGPSPSGVPEGDAPSAIPPKAPAITQVDDLSDEVEELPFTDPLPEPPKVSLSRHPAIRAIRRVTTRIPHRSTHEGLIEAIGMKPDLPLLTKCWREWGERGYNGNSLKWATEWYPNGGPPGRQIGKAKPTREKRTITIRDPDTGELKQIDVIP